MPVSCWILYAAAKLLIAAKLCGLSVTLQAVTSPFNSLAASIASPMSLAGSNSPVQTNLPDFAITWKAIRKKKQSRDYLSRLQIFITG